MVEHRLSLQGVTQNEKELHLCVDCRSVTAFPLHTHDYFELEIITDGGGRQNLNGKEYALHRGCVTLLTPADFHSVEASESHLTLWNISLDETLLSEEIQQAFFKNSGICREVPSALLRKTETAAALLREESETDGCVRPLIDYILSLLTDFSDSGGTTAYSPIRDAILYIETHFRESPSLAQCARRACLSTVYFGNLFRKTTGQTYTSYLNARKVKCAAMLLESGLSVTQACFASGFGSLSGFLYTFKKAKGITPEEYKNSYGKYR